MNPRSKIFPIKYKIQLALTSMTALVLVAYIFVSKNVFENDKVAYLYDSSLSGVRSRSTALSDRIVNLLSTSKALILSYNYGAKNWTKSGNFLFQESKEILALSLYEIDADGVAQEKFFKEKRAGVFRQAQVQTAVQASLRHADGEIELLPIAPADGVYVLSANIADKETTQRRRLFILVDLQNFSRQLKKEGIQNFYLLDAAGAVIGGENVQNLSALFATEKLSVENEKSFTAKIQNRAFIISLSRLEALSVFVVSSTPQDEAFEALHILYRKSILFFIFVIAITLILSLLLAKTLTQNLERLTSATERISGGDFDVEIKTGSRDEVGVLTHSFNQMAKKIRQLISEIVVKTRMEAELKTARAVQDTLFPESSIEHEKFSIHGFYMSASECGGDWWYHYQSGSDVYLIVADATGHGVPAALVTSAARSAFSILSEMPNQSLETLVERLSKAIFDTSKAKILMTAFMLKMNIETGAVDYVNASHEAPIVLQVVQNEKNFEYLIEPIGPRLGDANNAKYSTGRLILNRGAQIFLYTDGLIDAENPAKRKFGERRLVDFLAKSNVEKTDPLKVVEGLATTLRDFCRETPLNDDVTFALISLKS